MSFDLDRKFETFFRFVIFFTSGKISLRKPNHLKKSLELLQIVRKRSYRIRVKVVEGRSPVKIEKTKNRQHSEVAADFMVSLCCLLETIISGI